MFLRLLRLVRRRSIRSNLHLLVEILKLDLKPEEVLDLKAEFPNFIHHLKPLLHLKPELRQPLRRSQSMIKISGWLLKL